MFDEVLQTAGDIYQLLGMALLIVLGVQQWDRERYSGRTEEQS